MTKVLLPFLIVSWTTILTVNGLLAGGINVCTAYQRHSRTTKYSCGLFGWWRCSKTVYYQGASYHCCSGFHSRDDQHCDYANTCGHPGEIPNGHIRGTNFAPGGTVYYSCDNGYEIVHGSHSRTCQKNGLWSGVRPTCLVVDPCLNNDCRNGASCVLSGGVRICNCAPGWQGEMCQNTKFMQNLVEDEEKTFAKSFNFTFRYKDDVMSLNNPKCREYVNAIYPRIACSVPDTIENGYIIGNNFLFESSITYACNPNFNLTNGYVTRVCKSDGTWSGSRPSCIQSNTCVSSPCQNQGTCVDGLGTYSCMCPHGWSGVHCQNDILAPSVLGCQNDVVVYGLKPLQQVNWTQPVFEDPRGGHIEITANYDTESQMFPYGTFQVYYEAVKPNTGIKSTCQFDITVQPYPCDELNIPSNGARVCTNWKTRFGKFCKVYCHVGFSTPNTDVSSLFVCGASGHWKPAVLLPNCTEVDFPFNTAKEHNIFCDDASSIKDIKMQFLLSLKTSHFSYFCRRYQDECNEKNVSVQC